MRLSSFGLTQNDFAATGKRHDSLHLCKISSMKWITMKETFFVLFYLFCSSPIFSCSFSFHIPSLCYHHPFHIFFFPPFSFLSFHGPPLLSFHFLCIHQVNISLFPQSTKKNKELLLFAPNLVTYIVACSPIFVCFYFRGFDLKLFGVIRVLSSTGFRSRPAARPVLKPLCKGSS